MTAGGTRLEHASVRVGEQPGRGSESVWARAWRRVVDGLRWDEVHEQLASQPVFAMCTRREIRRIARCGDAVEIGPGEVVLREDRIGYWFLLVLSGEVELSRQGHIEGRVGAGGHLGAVAILGFGPQPATATSTSRVAAFVINRRDLLSLSGLRSVQRGLFPELEPDGYVAHVRNLRAEGERAWRALPKRRHPPKERESLPAAFRVFTPRAATGFAPMVDAVLHPAEVPHAAASSRIRLSRRAVATVSAIVATLVAAVGFVFHPPVAVASPSEPVDISDDFTIDGAPSYPVSGRYMLLAVDFRRPHAWGTAWAWATGQTIVAAGPDGEAGAAAYRDGRRAFVSSREVAMASALRVAGLDADLVDVEVRDRDYVGPSAGLVYALALADLLTADDLAAGRTVAVTGGLDADGKVLPIAFVDLKADGARDAEASVFLVPAGQTPPGAIAVKTFAEAREKLRAVEDG